MKETVPSNDMVKDPKLVALTNPGYHDVPLYHWTRVLSVHWPPE